MAKAIYQLPESKKSLRQNQFEFQIPSRPNDVFRMPKAEYLAVDVIEMMIDESLSDEEKEVTQLEVFRYLLGTIPGDVKKDIDASQLEDLFGAWQEASKTTLKKSSASRSGQKKLKSALKPSGRTS